MNDLLKELGVFIRTLGFKGSGKNFRKAEVDFVFVINIQGHRNGDVFFINLGAQPVFVPAECNAALATLKEHECIMRSRVGNEWQWNLPSDSMPMLKKEIEAAQDEFFGHMRTMPTVISSEPVEHLIREFSAGTTPSRAALHLARAAFALGHRDTALALAEHGLAIAGERATALIYDLKAVRQAAM